jgi:hypothetical protein
MTMTKRYRYRKERTHGLPEFRDSSAPWVTFQRSEVRSRTSADQIAEYFIGSRVEIFSGYIHFCNWRS